jgi:tetratricopeptide (TPR) repeat protein
VSFGVPSPAQAWELHAQIYLDNLGEDDEGDEDEALDLFDGNQLRLPESEEGADGSHPPHSAEDTKEDKLGLGLGDMPLPLDRSKLLAALYERLGAAQDAKAAQPIMATIEELWRISGSDTVDLLVARAERFIQEDDLDLALQILDAAGDIAPDDAEVWHQRAKVHALKQNHERALTDLRRTLDIDPKHYGALNDLGVVLNELGAKKDALKTYRQALEVNPFLDNTRRAADALSREVEGQDI